jgi:D-glycero-D-manno-heptose 1,7-bisphosphate phosphatase
LGTKLIPSDTPICFLDRDGVVIKEVIRKDKTIGSIRDLIDFKYCEGSKESIQKITSSNIPIVIISNQPDLNRGQLSQRVLEQTNSRILNDTGVLAICTCPHDSITSCNCRKPKTGMIEYFEKFFKTPLSKSIVIGDRISDINMGLSKGLYPIHIDGNNSCVLDSHAHFKQISDCTNFVMSRFYENL